MLPNRGAFGHPWQREGEDPIGDPQPEHHTNAIQGRGRTRRQEVLLQPLDHAHRHRTAHHHPISAVNHRQHGDALPAFPNIGEDCRPVVVEK